MHSNLGRRAAVSVLFVFLGVSGYVGPAVSADTTAPPGGDSAAQHDSAGTTTESVAGSSQNPQAGARITELLVAPSGRDASKNIALNDKLAVVIEPAPAHPASQYVLFLNDSEVKGLAPAVYTLLENGKRGLVFKLARNGDNGELWKELLGAPKRTTLHLTVGLGERPEPCADSQPCKSPDITIRGTGKDKQPLGFDFTLISWPWLAGAVVAVGVVVVLVLGRARNSTTLRDSYLPQLPPRQQTYSLGRWQMAFWFVLVLSSFVFLYVLLWDYNTVSTQALALMGISGATALAAVAVDVAKDSPADAVNRALQALGLSTYADVTRVKEEMEFRKPLEGGLQRDFDTKSAAAEQARQAAKADPDDKKLKTAAQEAERLATVAEQALKQLQAEIQDRLNVLQAYNEKTKPFISQGWLKDLTTDVNGPTVHRIQVLCWTIVLGLVFLVGVYRDLAMPPDFSATLLALMGISGAGYVGLKWPEKNS